jgi:hypothetical protein
MNNLKSFGIVTNIRDDWHTNAQSDRQTEDQAAHDKNTVRKKKAPRPKPGRLKCSN